MDVLKIKIRHILGSVLDGHANNVLKLNSCIAKCFQQNENLFCYLPPNLRECKPNIIVYVVIE